MVQKIEIDIEAIFKNLQNIEIDDNTKELLNNGICAYIKEPNMKDGVMIKLYPNGKKEIVYIDKNFQENVINF